MVFSFNLDSQCFCETDEFTKLLRCHKAALRNTIVPSTSSIHTCDKIKSNSYLFHFSITKTIVCIIPRQYVFVYFGLLVLHGVELFCRVLPALRGVLQFHAGSPGRERVGGWARGKKKGGRGACEKPCEGREKAWRSSRRRDWRGAVSAESMRRQSGGCLRNRPAVSEPNSRGSSCSRSCSLARSLPSFTTCLSPCFSLNLWFLVEFCLY